MDDQLIEAAKEGDIDQVNLLLDQDADIHFKDDLAFRCAVSNNHIEIVRLFLNNGADIHSWCDEALCCAASNGYTEIVKLLLNRGAYIYNWDHQAIREAIQNNHIEIVELLLHSDRKKKVYYTKRDTIKLIGIYYVKKFINQHITKLLIHEKI